ncbi:MAG: flagellar basal body P-ring formation chaperone FlgA [Pseudomonas sp.]
MTVATTYSRHLKTLQRALLCVVPALCGLGYSLTAAATATLPEQLIGAAETFLELAVEDYLQRTEIQGRHEVQINRLDPRLRLPVCDQELSVSLQSPAQPIGRLTLSVRCEGSRPWSVFVPGEVRLYRDVVIVRRPLNRGSVLRAADIALLERDVGLLNQGYLTDLNQALGKQLTRPLQTDQVLSPSNLELAEVISRGDQVVISASSGTISVRMPGVALRDGAVGEQIQVRNQSSQRVIRARVMGPGQVEVAM